MLFHVLQTHSAPHPPKSVQMDCQESLLSLHKISYHAVFLSSAFPNLSFHTLDIR